MIICGAFSKLLAPGFAKMVMETYEDMALSKFAPNSDWINHKALRLAVKLAMKGVTPPPGSKIDIQFDFESDRMKIYVQIGIKKYQYAISRQEIEETSPDHLDDRICQVVIGFFKIDAEENAGKFKTSAPFTGEHWDLTILDEPIKPQTATTALSLAADQWKGAVAKGLDPTESQLAKQLGLTQEQYLALTGPLKLSEPEKIELINHIMLGDKGTEPPLYAGKMLTTDEAVAELGTHLKYVKHYQMTPEMLEKELAAKQDKLKYLRQPMSLEQQIAVLKTMVMALMLAPRDQRPNDGETISASAEFIAEVAEQFKAELMFNDEKKTYTFRII